MFYTILISLASSFFIVLFATPVVRFAAHKLRLYDKPSARKMHKVPIPRLGGITIYFGVIIGGLLGLFFREEIINIAEQNINLLFVLGASVVVFLTGIWDDIKGLAARYKLVMQVIAACLAIYGGVVITKITIPFEPHVLNLGYWGIPVTLFWYLLIMNGFNLIDGLDGLAAGIALFVSLALLIIIFGSSRLIVTVFLASIAGSCLAFLRYNFNPATIFMGDSGSYFLGFSLATLSIMGSIKGQTTVIILAPLVALGLPIFDSMFSAIRRFLLGRSIFSADREHLHHKMLSLGYDQRRITLVFYGVTVLLCGLAILLVQINDERSALILILLLLVSFVGIRRLGYFKFLGPNRLTGWISDLYEDIGLRSTRRQFRGMMMNIAESLRLEDFWDNIVSAAIGIEAKYLGLRLNVKDKEILWREASVVPFKNVLNIEPEKDIPALVNVCMPIYSEGEHVGFLDLSLNLTKDKIDRHIPRRMDQLWRTLQQCSFELDFTAISIDEFKLNNHDANEVACIGHP